MERILIIDDDVALCNMLTMYVESFGMQVSFEHHAVGGVEAIRREKFDLVVLDVMLPGMDGFLVLRSIRTWTDVSVLLLTARGGQDDRITGFESGADDYLAKPFHPPELIARIRAILRRSRSSAEAGVRTGRLFAGDVSMELRSRTVTIGTEPIDLTAVEFDLLAAFLDAPGQVLSRESLVERVFSRPFHPEDRSLDMCVSRLRRKMDSTSGERSRIKTVRSAGYLFSVNA
jgi:DNA-binding response OmpR family regulator